MEAAIRSLQMALSIDVHYAKASLLLGVLYRQRGRPHDLTLAQVFSQSLCASWCTLRCTCYHYCMLYHDQYFAPRDNSYCKQTPCPGSGNRGRGGRGGGHFTMLTCHALCSHSHIHILPVLWHLWTVPMPWQMSLCQTLALTVPTPRGRCQAGR